MKKLLISMLLLITAQLSYTQENNFTVSGTIKGLSSNRMYFSVRDQAAKGGFRRDSILVENESFSFTGNINEATHFSISPGVEAVMKRTGRGYYPVKSSLLQFIASPGAHIKFAGKITDFVDAYPSGDEANRDLASLNKKIYPLMNEGVNLSLKIANKEVTDSLAIQKMNAQIGLLDSLVVSIKKQFIADNPASIAAAWQLSDMMIRSQVTGAEAGKLFAAMDATKLVGNPYYTEVAKRLDGIAATGAGRQVPEINSMNTYDGKKFTLSSLKGKYVVLDFWGTWCGPCIAGMPEMKKYLETYKDKMEIVGIAQESDNGDRWRKFLKENPGYQWRQVLSRKEEDYILKFSVAGFPTKIIVDPTGKIVGRFVGEDDAIYKKLDDLLKN